MMKNAFRKKTQLHNSNSAELAEISFRERFGTHTADTMQMYNMKYLFSRGKTSLLY